jgi:hypothetical protein
VRPHSQDRALSTYPIGQSSSRTRCGMGCRFADPGPWRPRRKIPGLHCTASALQCARDDEGRNRAYTERIISDKNHHPHALLPSPALAEASHENTRRGYLRYSHHQLHAAPGVAIARCGDNSVGGRFFILLLETAATPTHVNQHGQLRAPAAPTATLANGERLQPRSLPAAIFCVKTRGGGTTRAFTRAAGVFFESNSG